MKSVDQWNATLRATLRVALGARDPAVVTVLRETPAALDNAVSLQADVLADLAAHAGDGDG